jgi:hypothetical protein
MVAALVAQPPGHCDRSAAACPPPQLLEERNASRELQRQFNSALPYSDFEGRRELLKKLLGGCHADSMPFIEP